MKSSVAGLYIKALSPKSGKAAQSPTLSKIPFVGSILPYLGFIAYQLSLGNSNKEVHRELHAPSPLGLV